MSAGLGSFSTHTYLPSKLRFSRLLAEVELSVKFIPRVDGA
jgi:hypothetical protein